MDKLKSVLLVLIVLLLVVQIIDRSRATQQMQELNQEVKRLNSSIQRLASAPVVASNPAAAGTAPQGAATPAAERDGKPRLSVNFLLPYDASHFDPDQVRGTWVEFEASPKGLNPIIDNSATASDVASLCNDRLASLHPAHPQLWSESLATSLLISEDYQTYTFTIRPGVRWQRPEIARQSDFAWLDRDVELTAHDFAFYLDMVMNADVESPHLKAYYEDLASWRAIDDLTLEIKWKRKVYTSLAASMGLEPLPRHIYGANADGTPIPAERLGATFNEHWFDQARQFVGVGAYLLDEWTPDEAISFRRNPDYWGAPLHFERIRWDGAVKLPDPQLVGFKNGQAHTLAVTPTQYKSEILDHHEKRFAAIDDNHPKAGRTGELGWERVRSSNYSYIGWNQRLPMFADKRVRRALTHAFPKERIIREVFFGLGRPQVTNVHPDSVYFNGDLPDVAFDLGQAKLILAEAGWTDSDGDGWIDREIQGRRVPFRFTLKYYANSPEWDSTLLIYRNELRKVGIDMTPRSYEWKELIRVYEDKDFEAVAGAWRFGLEVDFYQLWHSSAADEPRSSNHIGFRNARADELANDLRTTFDTDERVRIAREFQALIHDEQPYTFFRSGEGIFAWQNKGTNRADQLRYLDGVIDGLDAYHPLFNREPLRWHFSLD